MPRATRKTDAELVQLLKLVEKAGGNIAKAARDNGLNRTHLNQCICDARARGLTANSKVLDEQAKLKAELAAANRRVKMIEQENDDAEKIREEIYSLAARCPEPPEWLSRPGTLGSRGCPIVLWSDWHRGEVVRPEEVGGVNEFNSNIHDKRVKRLVNTTVDLAHNHMSRSKIKYPGAIVCLGGDFINGDIHEELVDTSDRTTQQNVNELTDLMAGAIEEMASKFGKVFLPCVVGNHGRNSRRPRMKSRVYTSHEWNIYCNLARFFRRSKHVQFLIPGETDAHFNVFGHRYLLTHGDSMGVKGGDGIIGAIGPIMRGAIKVGRSEAQIGRDFDTILMGHWHQMLWLPNAIVNNSLKGYDEFARLALRAPYSRPSQALWFTHPEHGITARWEVFLEAQRKAEHGNKWVEWQDVAG